jgi:hypothetical protein
VKLRVKKSGLPVWLLTVSLIFNASLAISSAESATIKNGISCKKVGQKAKAGKKNYVCGKNPYVSPTKLTWMLTECPDANELFLEAKDQYEIFKSILSSTPEGIEELGKLQKSMDSLQALMKNEVCKKGK